VKINIAIISFSGVQHCRDLHPVKLEARFPRAGVAAIRTGRRRPFRQREGSSGCRHPLKAFNKLSRPPGKFASHLVARKSLGTPEQKEQ
jgi:hypothetical protein